MTPEAIAGLLTRHLQPTPFEPSIARAAAAVHERIVIDEWSGKDYDDLIETLQSGIPESWDQDAAGEAIVIDYVREIERRLIALGGTLERVGKVGASTVADRRAEAAAAFEATYDDIETDGVTRARDAALTVATQVRLAPAALDAYARGWDVPPARRGLRTEQNARRLAGLAAALTELGFEVVP